MPRISSCSQGLEFISTSSHDIQLQRHFDNSLLGKKIENCTVHHGHVTRQKDEKSNYAAAISY